MVQLPFQQIDLKGLVAANKTYWAAKDLMKDFVRYMPNRPRSDVWVAVDKEMEGRGTHELPQVFQNCAKIEFPWTLRLYVGKAPSISHIAFDARVREIPLWVSIGKALAAADKENGRAVVVFRALRLGVWIAHNLEPPTDKVFICIPAQTAGMRNIIIEPIKQWAERIFA